VVVPLGGVLRFWSRQVSVIHLVDVLCLQSYVGYLGRILEFTGCCLLPVGTVYDNQ
jgi:hypothetical protein